MNRRGFFRTVAAGAGALWLPDVRRVYSFPNYATMDVETYYATMDVETFVALFRKNLQARLDQMFKAAPVPWAFVGPVTPEHVRTRTLPPVSVSFSVLETRIRGRVII